MLQNSPQLLQVSVRGRWQTICRCVNVYIGYDWSFIDALQILNLRQVILNPWQKNTLSSPKLESSLVQYWLFLVWQYKWQYKIRVGLFSMCQDCLSAGSANYKMSKTFVQYTMWPVTSHFYKRDTRPWLLPAQLNGRKHKSLYFMEIALSNSYQLLIWRRGHISKLVPHLLS